MKKSNLILSALLLCIAILIGVIVQDNSQSTQIDNDSNPMNAVNSPTSKTDDAAKEHASSVKSADIPAAQNLDELTQQLRQEREKRENLQSMVEQLQERLDKLTQQVAVNKAAAQEDNNPRDKTITTGSRNIPQQLSGWVDATRLAEAGISKEQSDNITQLYEAVEMDKLYLRDRAQREGWMASERFRNEMDKLDDRTDNLRNELGDQAYDALLYATGKPNRVIVEGTLGNSPAAQAGVKTGDTILRYADKPIYSWYDLRTATTEGDASEMVALEIQRGNKHMEFYVKRGPLGIRLDQQSVNPVP